MKKRLLPTLMMILIGALAAGPALADDPRTTLERASEKPPSNQRAELEKRARESRSESRLALRELRRSAGKNRGNKKTLRYRSRRAFSFKRNEFP